MNKKLFCTFTDKYSLENTTDLLKSNYTFANNSIFVLKNTEVEDEFMCTYSIEHGNILLFPENTILVHRKRESNTLYTINALNLLIQELNNGVLDKKFPITWENYSNSVLLTRSQKFIQVNTVLHTILKF
jgi:hypothetical protein